MKLIHSPSELATLLDANAPDGLVDASFDEVAWLKDPNNLALCVGYDLAMFEYRGEGTWFAHVWFNSRGGQALETARLMLDHMASHYGAKVILGETPTFCRAALIFIRKLGFKMMGKETRPQGEVILSRLLLLTT